MRTRNLAKLVDDLPRVVKIGTIINELEKKGITQTSFYRDRRIKKGEITDIPGERLLVYSKLFSVGLLELFNYDIVVPPIIKRQSIAARVGLKG